MDSLNLIFIPHHPAHLLGLVKSSEAYEKTSGMRIANGVREFLFSASPGFFSQLEAATAADSWKFGFAIMHKVDNIVMGMCGFTGPPDSDGAVEIGYSIAPAYQGKGYATEAATALVEFASASGNVRTIRAHTLAEINASTRVLEKCGFRKTDELVDSENNLVWRWERSTSTS